MIDQDLSVDSESFIKPLFIVLALPGNIAHGKEESVLQPFCLSGAYHPEISQRFVAPEQIAVAFLIQLCDPDTVLIRRHLFGNDIHADLCEVHVCTDADCSGDPCRPQNVPHDFYGHEPCRFHTAFPGFFLIEMKIRTAVDEGLVDAVHMDILRSHIFQYHAVDQRRDPFIFRHPGKSDEVGKGLPILTFPSADGLFRFEQPRPSRNTLCL